MSIITDSKQDKSAIKIAYDDKKEFYISLDKKLGTTCVINSIPIKPFPYLNQNNNQRSGIFISGISGSGKSTLASHFMNELKSIVKPKKIIRLILITGGSSDDPVFDTIKNLIKIPAKTIDGYTDITIDNLENSIIIFDDWEALPKELLKFTQNLIKECLENGRKKNIHPIVITHQTMNYSLTRGIIFECETYCLSPSTNPNSVKKFLINYVDIDKKEAEDIVNSVSEPFEWLIIHKSLPRYYITRKKICAI